MNAFQRDALFERYKTQVVTGPLQFPLTGKANRPIFDAAGRIVSIPEHAPMFMAAANFVHEIATSGDDYAERIRERAKRIMEQQP